MWNFPAWIYEKLSGTCAESSLPCLMWGKSMLAAVTLASAGGVKIIYDIIGMMFAIWSVQLHKRRLQEVLSFFTLAITCKYFALILFICMVLLYKKRILYIISDMVPDCGLVLVEKLLFSFGKSYAEIHPEVAMAAQSGRKIAATGILSTRMGYLFSLQYHMGVDYISIFVLAMGLLLAYCYLQKREENYISLKVPAVKAC